MTELFWKAYDVYDWFLTKVTGKTSLQRLEELYLRYPPVPKKPWKPQLRVIKGGMHK